MAHDLKFKQGSITDLKQLKELGLASYGEFSRTLTSENWQIMRTNLNNEEKLLRLIESSTVFVCEHNNAIIGMAYLMPRGNPTHIYPAEWSYIRMVGMHPDYRGIGIAKKLTQQCIEQAMKAGEQTIGLHTSEIMQAARHIYESLGFKIHKEIEPIFGVRYWLYRMDIGQ